MQPFCFLSSTSQSCILKDLCHEDVAHRQTAGSASARWWKHWISSVCVCVRACVRVCVCLDDPEQSVPTERKEQTATRDRGSDICLMCHSAHAHAAAAAWVHICRWLFLNFIGITRWLLTHANTPMLKCALNWMQFTRDPNTHSSYSDTRRLRGTTPLFKAPDARVGSSLHSTSGICILTKHLAVSAPVHHSGDTIQPYQHTHTHIRAHFPSISSASSCREAAFVQTPAPHDEICGGLRAMGHAYS